MEHGQGSVPSTSRVLGALGLIQVSGPSPTHGSNRPPAFRDSMKNASLPQRRHRGLRIPLHMDPAGKCLDAEAPHLASILNRPALTLRVRPEIQIS